MHDTIYSVNGKVIQGDKMARKLGFPTVNLECPKNFSLQRGIYAGIAIHNNKVYKGVINIGITPNHLQTKPKLEMHIFNFSQNVYGEIITIHFIEFIRPEIKFLMIKELIGQISLDCEKAKDILAKF